MGHFCNQIKACMIQKSYKCKIKILIWFICSHKKFKINTKLDIGGLYQTRKILQQRLSYISITIFEIQKFQAGFSTLNCCCFEAFCKKYPSMSISNICIRLGLISIFTINIHSDIFCCNCRKVNQYPSEYRISAISSSILMPTFAGNKQTKNVFLYYSIQNTEECLWSKLKIYIQYTTERKII